ncbi:NAD(P)-binding protein [Thozetella sp. PMI_491]|nr:NAD(P)-binding protein [Thozetella sp. PMI_491]
MAWPDKLAEHPLLAGISVLVFLVAAYLFRLNQILSSTPSEVQRLTPKRWNKELLLETYRRLEASPITTSSYADRIPPKLERRYIVTGGSGLVGGYIVLQLLERGQPPESIRIVDFQKPNRPDMLNGFAAEVDHVHTDISSKASTDAAFAKPWHPSVARLPLTVFHTAAVISASDRYQIESAFCDAVNIQGTRHILDAARRSGADVLVSTTSGSISIRPVKPWMAPWSLWSAWPENYAQPLDDADFFKPLRQHGEFYANYPAAKAAAERIVCEANSPSLRTGSIRPANGVYGNPTDNTVGTPMTTGVCPEWTDHIVQSFVHGCNVAIAHLQFEAVLATPDAASAPQAGRPFIITDPNKPIIYQDLYFLLATLSATGFKKIPLPPVPLLLVGYAIEWYQLARLKYPILGRLLPAMTGDAKHLKPALFSICTHLFANNAAAARSVAEGGIGYQGVLTTLEGMTQEVVEWNKEQKALSGPKKAYRSSLSLADEIQKFASVTSAMAS